MVFTSFNFLIFFPLLVALYWTLPSKLRWILLLGASVFFYLNIKPVFVLLLAGVTGFTWLFTTLMDKTDDDGKKKLYMRSNVFLILLPLFFFKYFGSINAGMISLMDSFMIRWPLPEIALILPVGISFYTFMAIGYTIDVYNEEVEAEKNIGIVALFVSFFPLILSGPIERAENMLPQYKTKRTLEYGSFVSGMKMILWGYFLKLVVSNQLGIYVDAVYNNVIHHNGTTFVFASFLYPFQVYTDLGGYSLIAIGTAKLLGFQVMRNFNRPFFATSMSEFWRRWHISLISWLTDYVYTPLSFAFRKYKLWGIVLALMVTFFISGVWHGAALTFVVWGVLQGAFLSIEALLNKRRGNFEKKHNLTTKWWYIFLCIAVTFVLFAISQIFARALSIEEAFQIFRKIFTEPGKLFISAPSTLIYASLGLIMVLFKDFTEEFMPKRFRILESKYKAVRIMAYASLVIMILLIGVFDSGQFIYFQF